MSIKTSQEIDYIREAWKYLNELLNIVWENSKEWTSLLELEMIASSYLKKNNVTWSFKGYEWFPANLCLSVNECVVHWIPDWYILKSWDVLKIDAWVTYKKMISDSAITVVIWGFKANPTGQRLVEATKLSLDEWLKFIAPGENLFNFAVKVNQVVKSKWFSILQNLTGHWVGYDVHEKPFVVNYPENYAKSVIAKPWMVLALEPITAVKSKQAIEKKWVAWNMYTQKWDISAQWEYTIVITKNWYEILAGIE